jgi:hypothetical protein
LAGNDDDDDDNDSVKAILQNPTRFKKACDGIQKGDYDGASTDSQELWTFIWSDLLPKVVPVTRKPSDNVFHSSCQHEVTKDSLMQTVPVSDEALVMTILAVKGKTFHKQDDDNISGITQSTAGSSADDSADEEHADTVSAGSKRSNQMSGKSSTSPDIPVIFDELFSNKK